MSLGLNDDPRSAYLPPPQHKSAGLAFGLSLLVPGAGQFYCSKMGRGGMTLAFWLLGLLFCFTGSSLWVGMGLGLMVVLWIFSFLDAYFTAIEINRGIDDQVDTQNPRVAVTLNLVTAGFGYFYLGERAKGITLFIVMQVSRLFIPPMMGVAGGAIQVLLLVVQLAMAADAYRIARRQLRESLRPDVAPVRGTAPASRLPVQVPLALAGVLTFGFVVLIVIGLAVGPRRSARRRPLTLRPQSSFREFPANGATLIPAIDLVTAVQNVEQVERDDGHRHLKKEAIPNLRQDVRVLSSILTKRKIDAADAVVAHYFRAVALALINGVHYREGDDIDTAGAHEALADLNKVIADGPNTARTYVPAVSVSNAQYWAGGIARNHLRDEKAAYSYWEQCSGEGHAGCMNIVAGAHITGAGGEKVDFRQALDLHTIVFKSGIKYHCAGAHSAMSIAYINYFTNVRRRGDDELEWTQKSDELYDKLEATEHNRNVCDRAAAVVDEFLLQLGHGHRDDNILQDALTRLDDDSNVTKAVIQFISGAIDEAGLNAIVEADKSPGARCSAYFDALWYAELRTEDALARRYYQRLVEIGKFHCGQYLVYASKFRF